MFHNHAGLGAQAAGEAFRHRHPRPPPREGARMARGTGEMVVFEGFRLDRRGLFHQDERGGFAPVVIGSRALDVLRVLVEAGGDLVSKDEIMAAVWPGTVVGDNNLTVQISALRHVLDPAPPEGSWIQTVAGRGYRFVAPVTSVEPVSGDRDGGPEAETG